MLHFFKNLKVVNADISGPLTVSSGPLTASAPIALTQTWNNSGVTFTGLKFDVTDTASGSSSLLLNLQKNGNTQASINKNGELRLLYQANTTGGVYISPIGGGGSTDRCNVSIISSFFDLDSRGGVNPGVTSYKTHLFKSFVYFGTTATIDSTLVGLGYDGAAGTLAQRNGTNAQTFRIYNTYTDGSNYERGFMRWSSNVLEIGAEAAGTGTARNLRLVSPFTANLGTSVAWDFYNNGVARSKLFACGSQEWYLSDAAGNLKGKIAYATPGGKPGIIFATDTLSANRVNAFYYSSSVFRIAFDADANGGLNLKAGGNVGIGTISPSYKLHIKYSEQDDPFKIERSDGLMPLVITGDGNISLYKLDVAGDIASNNLNLYAMAILGL